MGQTEDNTEEVVGSVLNWQGRKGTEIISQDTFGRPRVPGICHMDVPGHGSLSQGISPNHQDVQGKTRRRRMEAK